VDPGKRLCNQDPPLIHFHGMDRHVTRVFKMRAFVKRLTRARNGHTGPVPTLETA
jgi:hypothetical protein